MREESLVETEPQLGIGELLKRNPFASQNY